jgi:molybdopterin converting factor small subunit
MDSPRSWGDDCQMTAKVKLSGLLRQFSELQGEPEVFEVAGSNPLECLRLMVERYPKMKKWVYDKDGKLLGLMQFFVNGEKLLPSEHSKPLKDGDEVYIFFATGGG